MTPLENRFFQGFSVSGREALLPHLKVEGFHDGVFLFREGDPPDGIYLIIEGEVEVLKIAGQREQLLTVYAPGEFLGEAAVLDGNGRSTCTRARGHVVVVKVPTKPLMDVLAKEPVSVTIHLFQRVLTYFRRTNDLFVREVIHKEKLSLVGEMAASLMHDLRNPLSGIQLSAELLKMTHQDADTIRTCEGISKQCTRIAAMATDLLEVSRGEVQLHLEHTDTVALLDQFQALNPDYIRQSGVTINFKAEPAAIEVDSMRLLRLLQNLVTNAVEATSKKPGGLIEVEAWTQDLRFYLTVKDNGPGLPDPIVQHIFEPFTTFGKKGGTGLGMTIVKNAVDAHHGAITFKTGRGEGTSFLIDLPQFATVAQEKHLKESQSLGDAVKAVRSNLSRDIAERTAVR